MNYPQFLSPHGVNCKVFNVTFFFKLHFKTFKIVFARIIMLLFNKKIIYNEFAVINCMVVLLLKKWEKFVNLMSKYYLNGYVDVG